MQLRHAYQERRHGKHARLRRLDEARPRVECPLQRRRRQLSGPVQLHVVAPSTALAVVELAAGLRRRRTRTGIVLVSVPALGGRRRRAAVVGSLAGAAPLALACRGGGGRRRWACRLLARVPPLVGVGAAVAAAAAAQRRRRRGTGTRALLLAVDPLLRRGSAWGAAALAVRGPLITS